MCTTAHIEIIMFSKWYSTIINLHSGNGTELKRLTQRIFVPGYDNSIKRLKLRLRLILLSHIKARNVHTYR